jgi:hypothetical protein
MDPYFMSRREFLGLGAGLGTSYFFGANMGAEENLKAAAAVVDHLLLGVKDLDAGMGLIEGLTGVKPVFGGSHPGGGTRNALISLGARRYLEIIAPDPNQKEWHFPIDLRKLTEPRLIMWAAATSDIQTSAKSIRKAGFEVSEPEAGSRARPDEKVLHWNTMRVMNQFESNGVEPIPFFIEWSSDSVHPSQDSPKGCELQSLKFEHPDSANLKQALQKLGISAEVKQSKTARITATIITPKGLVDIS